MSDQAPELFADPLPLDRPPRAAPEQVDRALGAQAPPIPLGFGPGEHLQAVYDRAQDPTDPFELRDLYLGRVEAALGPRSTRPELAAAWRAARVRRAVSAELILASGLPSGSSRRCSTSTSATTSTARCADPTG